MFKLHLCGLVICITLAVINVLMSQKHFIKVQVMPNHTFSGDLWYQNMSGVMSSILVFVVIE